MSGTKTTARPFLISDESGRAHGLPEFSYRPPGAFTGTVAAPPDNPWFVRLADWPPAQQTEPRPGAGQSAAGGTIFFEGVDDFESEPGESEPGSDPELGHGRVDFEPENQPRVVFWMRDCDPSLRSFTVGEDAAKSKKRLAEIIEFPSEENPEYSEVPETAVGRPLEVWTLWTSPQP
jgi:hypothetical protein